MNVNGYTTDFKIFILSNVGTRRSRSRARLCSGTRNVYGRMRGRRIYTDAITKNVFRFLYHDSLNI